MSSNSSAPPVELDGARVERFASVSGLSRKGLLLMDGREVEPPLTVAICRYAGEDSVFLFHCSGAWAVLAAGHYRTVEEATESANRGYPGVSARWVSRASPFHRADSFKAASPL
jgi:hypothetical protein